MTAWPPAESGYVVLRPAAGAPGGSPGAELAVGPAEVVVGDERGRRRHQRTASPGAGVAALRVAYTPAVLRAGVERLDAVELVDEHGQVLDGLRWWGADAAALERACAAARLPLEWAPAGPVRARPQRDVVLRRPQQGDPRFPDPYDPQMAVVLGRQQVSVVDGAGRRSTWPRVGWAPPGTPAVARLRLFRRLRPGTDVTELLVGRPELERVSGVALVGVDDRVLGYALWSGEQATALREAAAAVGLLVDESTQVQPETALARAGVPVLRSAQDRAPVRWQSVAALVLFVLVVVGGLAVALALSLR